MPTLTLPAFGNRSSLKIGLLGGSFNPAHSGHVHISEIALKELGLDQVWWLVSPQNPLKPVSGMAPFEKRFGYAKSLVQKNNKIIVTDLETKLGTQFTADSLAQIKKRYPQFQFVWMMGADNLINFHKWDRWQWIGNHFRIAVFHRPTYSRQSLVSPAAHRFKRNRIPNKSAKKFMKKRPPGWVFLSIRGKDISATQLRKQSNDWLASI